MENPSLPLRGYKGALTILSRTAVSPEILGIVVHDELNPRVGGAWSHMQMPTEQQQIPTQQQQEQAKGNTSMQASSDGIARLAPDRSVISVSGIDIPTDSSISSCLQVVNIVASAFPPIVAALR